MHTKNESRKTWDGNEQLSCLTSWMAVDPGPDIAAEGISTWTLLKNSLLLRWTGTSACALLEEEAMAAAAEAGGGGKLAVGCMSPEMVDWRNVWPVKESMMVTSGGGSGFK